MDCDTMRELLVPLLEDELSPSQQQLAAQHLETCADCAALASRISSHDAALASLSPDPDPRLDDPAFWAPMNAAVDAAWAARALGDPPGGSASSRLELRVTPVGMVAYAAALLLALAWGWSNHLDAQHAADQADRLRAEQQPAVRPATTRIETLPARTTQPYQPVRYTPRRGTF